MGVIVSQGLPPSVREHEHGHPPPAARRPLGTCERAPSGVPRRGARVRDRDLPRRLRHQGGAASPGLRGPTLAPSWARAEAATRCRYHGADDLRSGHGRRLHAARRLGPRRALGRQREAGRVLLRARVGLHAHGVRRPRDRRPRPRLLRARAGRRPLRGDERRCARTARSRSSPRRHGDGAKDIALQVPSASEAYREAVQRGARGIVEPHWVEDEFGRVELAAIAHLRRHDPHVRQPRATTPARSCPATARRGERPARAGVGLKRSTTSSATSSSAA